MSFWKTQSFKALQKAWYQRLEDDGFEDQEDIVGSDLVLKTDKVQPDNSSYRVPFKEAYYSIIGKKINDEEFEFASDIDRVILSMLAEGAKLKRIREELARQGNSRCRETIRCTIRKYERQWGIWRYSPKRQKSKQAI